MEGARRHDNFFPCTPGDLPSSINPGQLSFQDFEGLGVDRVIMRENPIPRSQLTVQETVLPAGFLPGADPGQCATFMFVPVSTWADGHLFGLFSCLFHGSCPQLYNSYVGGLGVLSRCSA